MKRALITGITGQDGSYLAEFLLEQGYEVHGVVRRASTEKFDRIEHLRERITLHQGDLLDQRSLVDALRAAQPDEVYNLAAMSFVAVSWIQPTLTAEFTGVGVTRMLEAVREACPEARFYQASSSEMFGRVRETPQSESTPFYPRSPYGVAKAYGHHITVNYRESYGLFGVLGDPLQPRVAAPRARVRHAQDHLARRGASGSGRCHELRLGNLDARRDWGYAKDYVEAMWLMLQQDRAGRLRDRDGPEQHRARLPRHRLRPGGAWAGRTMSSSTTRSSGPPRWTCSSATTRRPSASSAGAADELRGADPADGRRGPEAARLSRRTFRRAPRVGRA